MGSIRFPRKQEEMTTTQLFHDVDRLIEDSLCKNTLQNIIFLGYPNIPFSEEEAEALYTGSFLRRAGSEH